MLSFSGHLEKIVMAVTLGGSIGYCDGFRNCGEVVVGRRYWVEGYPLDLGAICCGVKKPACGRLLGDLLSLFLVSLTSLQSFTQAFAWLISGASAGTPPRCRAGWFGVAPSPAKCAAHDTDVRLSFPPPDLI